jgi:nucleotide-binding universal stress UspA family protein
MVCRIVRAHRGQLTILHVKLVAFTQPLPTWQPGADSEVDSLVSTADRFADRRGVRAASAVRYARELGAAVVAEARLRGADLIALLAPSIDRLVSHRGFGADIETLLRRATCGVMLFRPGRLSAGRRGGEKRASQQTQDARSESGSWE